MKITVIRTAKIYPFKFKLAQVLDKNLKSLKEKSIVVITSKIVSLCEGRVVKIKGTDKNKLIIKEADYYLKSESKYKMMLTLKNNLLIPKAGIDVSNSNGHYVLWPKNPQKTANGIRTYLINRFNVHNAGVIITDSRINPLRRGTTGIAIGYSGFSALNDYTHKTDVFGFKNLRLTKADVLDGLAASAVLAMGEGDEQTPLAVIEDLAFVKFVNHNPSWGDLKTNNIGLEEDLFAPILKRIKWLRKKTKKELKEAN